MNNTQIHNYFYKLGCTHAIKTAETSGLDLATATDVAQGVGTTSKRLLKNKKVQKKIVDSVGKKALKGLSKVTSKIGPVMQVVDYADKIRTPAGRKELLRRQKLTVGKNRDPMDILGDVMSLSNPIEGPAAGARLLDTARHGAKSHTKRVVDASKAKDKDLVDFTVSNLPKFRE